MELQAAKNIASKLNLTNQYYDSLLSLAAYQKAAKNGFGQYHAPCLIFSGL